MLYVDVILPLHLADSYTYAVPSQWDNAVMVGCRVVVQFGAKKMYTGIVLEVHERKPEGVNVKEIVDVLDAVPVVTPRQLDFWRWIANYYMCTMGDVYKAAIPAGMKLESETVVCASESDEALLENLDSLTPKERTIFDLLSSEGDMKITQLEKQGGLRNVLPAVTSLIGKGLVSIHETLRLDYKPKKEVRVRFGERIQPDKTNILMASLSRSKAQQGAFRTFVRLWEDSGEVNPQAFSLPKSELMEKADVSSAIIKALCDKGILALYEQEVCRLTDVFGDSDNAPSTALNELNEAQQKAYDEVVQSFEEKDVTLLHGVTSSGKTEIYIHLIRKYLSEGKQVLYLLPEIALTTQITERLRRVFGGVMGVYHSKFSDAERVEVYRKQVSSSPYTLILGVRSSVFLPFSNLGLVIVDEEHETSYKQQEPAPRYNARNAALVLARSFGAKTLLGTATPCFETYHNARKGRYGYVTLLQRYKNMQLPDIDVVDIKRLRKQKRMVGAFSPDLIDAMRGALERNEQIILFQNRRGYSNYVECKTCGWVPRCEHCDVSLTYHKVSGRLSCHYCGSTYSLTGKCPNCEEEKLVHVGMGTERIEDHLKEIFPEAKILRMDLDTARTRAAYERIISEFADHRADILVGTQMVTKGLDFDNVSIVGILDADTMLNIPDFRSYERAFHTLSQVAGRAGRKNHKGRVLLQTRSADSEIISQIVANDYWAMFSSQMVERQMFRYPPFNHLIYIYLRHRDNAVLDHLAADMTGFLHKAFGEERILGPAQPPVGRVQSLFIRKIIVKMELGASVLKVRETLYAIQHQVMALPYSNGLNIYYDVDPN